MKRKKIYLLAGGPGKNGNTAGQLRLALQNSGAAKPKVAYIGTASGDNTRFMQWFVRPFRAAGAASVTLVPLVGEAADETAAEQILRGSDVVFVSGGEVEDGIRGLSQPVQKLLRELLEDGKQFIGLSAGSIMQGRAWPHWEDEDNHPEEASLFDCLAFCDVIFDTHAEEEGWPELKKAVELSGDGAVGYGIPTGEMAVVDEEGKLIPNPALAAYVNKNGRVCPGSQEE